MDAAMKTDPTTTSNDPGDMGSNPPRLALRPREAAKALGIGERLLWSKTNSGEIPSVRIGRSVLYPIRELERWLSEQATGKRK